MHCPLLPVASELFGHVLPHGKDTAPNACACIIRRCCDRTARQPWNAQPLHNPSLSPAAHPQHTHNGHRILPRRPYYSPHVVLAAAGPAQATGSSVHDSQPSSLIPPTLLSPAEAAQLIRGATASWRSLADFLTAHSRHLPASCLPSLCVGLLGLAGYPTSTAEQGVAASHAPLPPTPLRRYPHLLPTLLHACTSSHLSTADQQPHLLHDQPMNRPRGRAGSMEPDLANEVTSGSALGSTQRSDDGWLLWPAPPSAGGGIDGALCSQIQSEHDEDVQQELMQSNPPAWLLQQQRLPAAPSGLAAKHTAAHSPTQHATGVQPGQDHGPGAEEQIDSQRQAITLRHASPAGPPLPSQGQPAMLGTDDQTTEDIPRSLQVQAGGSPRPAGGRRRQWSHPSRQHEAARHAITLLTAAVTEPGASLEPGGLPGPQHAALVAATLTEVVAMLEAHAAPGLKQPHQQSDQHGQERRRSRRAGDHGLGHTTALAVRQLAAAAVQATRPGVAGNGRHQRLPPKPHSPCQQQQEQQHQGYQWQQAGQVRPHLEGTILASVALAVASLPVVSHSIPYVTGDSHTHTQETVQDEFIWDESGWWAALNAASVVAMAADPGQPACITAADCAALLWAQAMAGIDGQLASQQDRQQGDKQGQARLGDVSCSRWLNILLPRLCPSSLSTAQLMDCAWSLVTLTPHLTHLTAAVSAPGPPQAPATDSEAQPPSTQRQLRPQRPATLPQASPASGSVQQVEAAQAPDSGCSSQVLHPSCHAPPGMEDILRALLLVTPDPVQPPARLAEAAAATTAVPDPASQPQPTRLSSKQAVDLLALLAQARLRLHGPAMTRLQGALTPAALAQLNPRQLAVAACALGKMRTGMQAKRLRELLRSFQCQLEDVSVADVAALVWALPHISRPYTRYMLNEQRPLLRALATATLPAITRVTAAQDPDASQDSTQQQQQQSQVESALPAELVQLAVGFTRLGYYPGAWWMRAHRLACIAMQQQFSETDRQRLRTAYQALLEM